MDASDEWASLWRELFGEPLPIRSETSLLAAVVVAALPSAPPYGPPPDVPEVCAPGPRTAD